MLSFVEYRTSGIYHACAPALQTPDFVQDSFLAVAGMSELEALPVASLAPLCVRRNVALLDVIIELYSDAPLRSSGGVTTRVTSIESIDCSSTSLEIATHQNTSFLVRVLQTRYSIPC